MKILQVDSSITGAASISRKLSQAIVARLVELGSEVTLSVRDLAADPLPVVDGATLAQATPEEIKALAAEILGEFMAADVIVIGAPMYNFGIPAQLKTWIDYLCIAGVTFRYTATGSEGLAGGRHIYIASARGGVYTAGSPAAGAEHQESYLRAVFGFLGISDINIISAEGIMMGPDHAERAMSAAYAQVAAIAA